MASIRARYKPGSAKVIGYIVDYRDAEGKGKTKGGFRLKYEAEAWITDLRKEQKDGTFIAPKVLSTRLDALAEEWLASLSHLKPVTVEGYRFIFNAHILPKFGAMKIGELTTGQIETWLKGLTSRRTDEKGKRLPANPQTIRNVNFALKACLNWAVRMDRIRVNPCDRVLLPKKAQRQPGTLPDAHKRKALTEGQVNALASLVGETHPTYGLVVRFAAYTGLRKGELLALRVQSLNTLHKLVEVTEAMSAGQPSSPKTAAGLRTVPIPAALWEELTAYLGDRINEPGSRVFIDPQPTNHHGAQPLVWRRFYRDAYAPAVTSILPNHSGTVVFHSLRHSYTSLLEELEVRPALMATILGHSTGKVTFDTYTHIGPTQLAAVGERINARFLAARNPDAAPSHLSAVPTPVEHVCPHCAGTGVVTPSREVGRTT